MNHEFQNLLSINFAFDLYYQTLMDFWLSLIKYVTQMKGLPAAEEDHYVRRFSNGDDRGEGSFVMRLMTEARSNAGMEAPLDGCRKSCCIVFLFRCIFHLLQVLLASLPSLAGVRPSSCSSSASSAAASASATATAEWPQVSERTACRMPF